MTEAPQPTVLTTVAQVRQFMAAERSAGRTVGLVPTMGALHAGHLSLVKASASECDTTLATIFVNPTQFGPSEDLDKYPRTFEQDLAKLASYNTAAVFAPANEEVYPPGYSTYVEPPTVGTPLEGAIREDHFRGVCTVVLKLFLMTEADVAFFGQKDFQQARVISQMVADLNVPIEIRICPIVREEDGLAMSSRNAYLSADERARAVGLYQALNAIEREFIGGNTNAEAAVAVGERVLREHGIEKIDYVAAIDPITLQPAAELQPATVVAIAAHVGSTRLIDNWRLGVDS